MPDPSGYPVREWTVASIPVQDCDGCGQPVFDLPRYGEGGRILLDALPLRTFRLVSFEEPYAALEHSEPRFSEHVCPCEPSARVYRGRRWDSP